MNTTLEVKERIKYNFMARANVVGVGIGEEGVTVMVTQKLPLPALDTKDIIPKVILGQPTDVIQVGEIRALPHTDKWRPAPGGVSIGHYKITAGTFGAPVQDEETGELLMLSNNHVLANSNNAEIGDPIYQPGPYDGGNANDTIAKLSRFVPIQFGTDGGTCPWADGYAKIGNLLAKIFDSNHRVSVYQVRPLVGNLVDAAVAKPINDSDVADYVLGIGVVSGTEEAYLGMGVCKSGRTTGYTEGKVTLTNATVKVGYGGTRIATFEDQIITKNMGAGGDSGSLLVSEDVKAVGLLFAGSDAITIFNPINHVLDSLEITI